MIKKTKLVFHFEDRELFVLNDALTTFFEEKMNDARKNVGTEWEKKYYKGLGNIVRAQYEMISPVPTLIALIRSEILKLYGFKKYKFKPLSYEE